MNSSVLHAAAAAAALLLLSTAAPAADQPASKGKSAERKPATTARGGYDIKKGTATKKQPTAGADKTAKPRQGLEANGREAQGVAHD